MERLFKALLRTTLFLVALTVIGQVHYEEETLESRYHEFVTSRQFQRGFYTAMQPVRWTGRKIADVIDLTKEKIRAKRRQAVEDSGLAGR